MSLCGTLLFNVSFFWHFANPHFLQLIREGRFLLCAQSSSAQNKIVAVFQASAAGLCRYLLCNNLGGELILSLHAMLRLSENDDLCSPGWANQPTPALTRRNSESGERETWMKTTQVLLTRPSLKLPKSLDKGEPGKIQLMHLSFLCC